MSYILLFIALFFAKALALTNLDTTKNNVGICYSVWHSLGYPEGSSAPPDITEILHGRGNFAGQQQWHFWGRPDGGYYRTSQRHILRRHFQQISDAGIDFIVIDATNLNGYGDYQKGLFTGPTDNLLDEMYNQRHAGHPTPDVVFWVRTASDTPDPAAVGKFVRDRYYSVYKYRNLWVTLDGKPLMLTTDTRPPVLKEHFTLRKQWGLQGKLANKEWSFLQNAPQNVGYKDGVAEQVSVAVAKQATYMTQPTATGRKGGRTFQQQWMRAFEVRPKVVMLTWWNEWMAQRQVDAADGSPQFVDLYNEEYSRDIEPQDPSQVNSLGDRYLTWTKAYIAAYKGNKKMPKDLTSE